MTNKLNDLINAKTHQDYATASGRMMHAEMGHVFFAPNGAIGDSDLLERLSSVPELVEIMGPLSHTEVPVAGYVNNRFISRRIDRLYINNDIKRIVILDYKTDVDKKLFYKKYTEQLKEYYALLKQIYQDYNIECKILWLNDFTLENII